MTQRDSGTKLGFLGKPGSRRAGHRHKGSDPSVPDANEPPQLSVGRRPPLGGGGGGGGGLGRGAVGGASGGGGVREGR